MAHVFISYFHEDFEFAENLKQRLEKAGFKVWMDEEKLRAGEDWREEIDEAIKKSFALLLLLTPKSVASRYVMYEWSFAWGADKKVIPILLIEVNDKDLHPRLDKRQYLNFTSRDARRWDKLIGRLKEVEASYNDSPKKLDAETIEKVNPGIERLLQDLKHKDAKIRIGAIKTLKPFEANVVIDGLIEMLRDTDSRVREAAANSLAEKWREDIPLALLVNLHADESRNVRITAANSLGSIGSPESIFGLINAATNDQDFDVREAAVYCLEGFMWSTSDYEYVSDLVKLLLNCDEHLEELNRLKEEQNRLRSRKADAKSALLTANNQLFLKDIVKELKLYETIASILEEIGTPTALAAVEEWRRKQQNQP